MKTTLGALAVAITLIAGIGAASAMPTTEASSILETVFDPDN